MFTRAYISQEIQKGVNILLTIRVLIGDIISYTCTVMVHENAVDCISEVLRN